MNPDPVRDRAITVAVITHVLHRLNEFLDNREDEPEQSSESIAREFFEWLSRKDASL